MISAPSTMRWLMSRTPESNTSNNTATHTAQAVALPSLQLVTYLWFAQ